ncbi:hypothetical protein [Pseudolactococcus yaeyamensis]
MKKRVIRCLLEMVLIALLIDMLVDLPSLKSTFFECHIGRVLKSLSFIAIMNLGGSKKSLKRKTKWLLFILILGIGYLGQKLSDFSVKIPFPMNYVFFVLWVILALYLFIIRNKTKLEK